MLQGLLWRSLLFVLTFVCKEARAWSVNSAFIKTSSTTTSRRQQRQSSFLTMSSSTSPSTSTASRPKPLLPLPPPICSDIPNTWAYDTMSRRVNEEILERTWIDNQETLESAEFQEINTKFQQLRAELQSAATTKLSMLDDLPSHASPAQIREYNEWKDILLPYIQNNDDTWLSAPWMVTEFYVYRRLMQCFDYWNTNSPGYMYDPFLKQKQAGLLSSPASAESMLQKIPNLPNNAEGIELAAFFALWGNKMDLSLWPADIQNQHVDVFTDILNSASENLLHDDCLKLADHCEKLRQKGDSKVDIIVDNAGFELVTDLALAQYLVQSGIAKCVTFQLKSHPTFVSDALEKDLRETVEYYASLDDYPNCQKAGLQWKQFLQDGSWKCHEDPFWVQPYAMWDMTEPLRTDMQQRCDLAFVKGDANYRRLLGDRMWDYTAPFSDVVGCYFPCPVCALRTLKAELGCGMDADQVERAKKLDDNWLTNGRFGVVQFGNGAPK